jgi:hypothetical protein
MRLTQQDIGMFRSSYIVPKNGDWLRATSLLKKGTGSERHPRKFERLTRREVPVPFFNTWKFIALALILGGVSLAEENSRIQIKSVDSQSSALLVGCTKYDFNESRSLKGPANDVALIYDLLVERFEFSPERIRRLVEGRSREERPTRANIVRELEALIRGARRGERIVLFFAGHGCQQPDQSPPDPNDPEPDGLDEVFLPCDIGPWNAEIQSIQNAIIDDEFRGWIQQLLAKDVELLVIFDSCHSGSATRGSDDEVSRRIDPAELIPAEVLSAANARAEQTRGGKAVPDQAGFDPLSGGKWVALYAALPEELTVELSLPRRSQQARKQGLFTYSLCQALRQSEPPSCRELLQRIRGAYLAQGRFTPTPLMEGTELDRGVLGGKPAAVSFQLEKNARGQWLIQAGQLHGCTEGSILAVRAAEAGAEATPVGYVKVIKAGLSESQVQPCAYQKVPVKETLPVGSLCRLVYADFGDQRLRVAIDAQAARGTAVDPLRAILTQLAGEKSTPIALVDDVNLADWLLINRAPSDQPPDWVLSPRSEVVEVRGLATTDSKPPMQFAVDLQAPQKIAETFESIARAASLLGLTARFGNEASGDLQLECALLYRAAGAPAPVPVNPDRPTTLAAGGKLQIRLTNRGRVPVDFNLLFVDSQFGIQAIFPRSFAADNRLPPRKMFETQPMTVTAHTVGREHIVLIAVPAGRAPTNFVFLTQPTLALAQRQLAQQRGGGAAQAFEEFLEFVAYRSGNTRGTAIGPGTDAPVVEVRSWIVDPQPRR